jgi:hypothetical protein
MITAARAIRLECQFCMGNHYAQSLCASKICKLRLGMFSIRSSAKRIAAHCLDCAENAQAVKGCTGILGRDNGNKKTCWLHPFRLGMNSTRPKKELTPEQLAVLSLGRKRLREGQNRLLLKNRPATHQTLEAADR